MKTHKKRERKNRRILWAKFIISAAFCLPLLYLAVVPMLWWLIIPYPSFLEPMQYPLLNALIQIALTMPILLTGYRFFTAGFKAFFRRSPNVDSLIAVGATASMGYSMYSTYQIYAGNFGATDGLYYITAAILITLAQLGRLLEARSKHRAEKAVQKITGKVPDVPYAQFEPDGFHRAARMTDTLAGYFVPITCVIAVVAAGAWIIGGKAPVFVLNIFLSVLVIACPISLGIAAPAASNAGSKKGAKYGILVKDAAIFEAARKINMVVLGKSGTITEGKPEVTDIFVTDETSREKLLQIAASVEKSVGHPLGEAIIRYAQMEELAGVQVDRFENIPGYGVAAEVDGMPILLGSRNFMEERSISLEASEGKSVAFAAEGKTPVYISMEGKIIGIIALMDKVKEESVKAILKLQSMGIEAAMVTGDHRKSAETVAKHAGVSRVFSQMTSKDRIHILKKLQAEGKKLAVVGRDIKDLPSILQADVGFATGLGSAPVMEASDIVLAYGSITDVATAIQLSRSTIRIMRGNLFWAFSYHVIGIFIAAGLLHLLGGPLMNPVLTVAAMLLGTVSVFVNTIRLKRFRPDM